jgi:hypothetical protein
VAEEVFELKAKFKFKSNTGVSGDQEIREAGG